MKFASTVLEVLSAASLAATPAYAQGYASSRDPGLREGSETQALFFFRIPFGESESREAAPRFGFGLFSSCSHASGLVSEAGRDACEATPLRSLEFSSAFGESDWTFALSGPGRRTEIAAWSPRTGALSLAEDGGGSIDWLWVGVGVAAVGLGLALTNDNEHSLCPAGQVSVPLGNCEPIS